MREFTAEIKPTRAECIRDRQRRDAARSEARARARRSGLPQLIEAERLASQGYGVDNLIVMAGVDRMIAEQLVLGT